jgi:hypothetical protein
MGGNLIGGWAHARDLIYVSKLAKHIILMKRFFRRLPQEKCGINAIISNPQMEGYFRNTGTNSAGKLSSFPIAA